MSASGSGRYGIKSYRQSYGSTDQRRAAAAAMRARSRSLARQATVVDTGPWAGVQSGYLPSAAVYGRPGGVEMKGCDQSLETTSVLDTVTTNGSSVVLNLIAPGTGSFNRVGRKIRMKSVRLFGECTYTCSDVDTLGDLNGGLLRMVVVYDHQPSGVIPTFDSIFGVTLQDGTETTGFLDPLKYDNMGRFRVLRDIKIEANPGAWVNAGGTQDRLVMKFCFDEYVKLRDPKTNQPLETVYSGQSSPCTIADISTGGLYVFFRVDDNVANKQSWNVTDDSTARLRYYD